MITRHLPVALLVSALLATARSAEPPANKTQLADTVIESGSAELVGSDKETTATFSQGVTVTATNLKLTCDHLVVIALRGGDPADTIGKQEKFKSLVATGRVRLLQNDREATCERAEIFPGDNKVVLTGNPRVRSLDGQYQATGPVMELLRGERRARIVGQPDAPIRITLPALKDLGYEAEKPKTPAPAAAPTITVPIPSQPK